MCLALYTVDIVKFCFAVYNQISKDDGWCLKENIPGDCGLQIYLVIHNNDNTTTTTITTTTNNNNNDNDNKNNNKNNNKNKNTERQTAHTIISWPNPKQWVIVHTSDLMMIIRQSICIRSIITREMGQLKTHSPTYFVMDNWDNMPYLTHTLDKLYLTGV